MKQLPARLQSIDTLRAITMLLMIFVNELSGITNIPLWMEHAEATEDRMGFADIIFPGFLFIVGLSVPLAINARKKKGDSFQAILLYIFSRSLALVVMGFFHVNMESYSAASVLWKPVWGILVTACFFLIWLDYPDTLSKTKKYGLQVFGIMLLLTLAYLYKGGSDDDLHGMRPSWWGILGIIGWAYLVCSTIYLLSGGRFWALLLVTLLFAGINISDHSGGHYFDLPLVGDASSVTLIMTGIVVTGLYTMLIEKNHTGLIWVILAAAGTFLIGAGIAIRPFAGGISKIQSTPAWVFICAGISILAFELLIFIVDTRKKQSWFGLIKAAGTSTLTCYLVPYLFNFTRRLTGLKFPPVLSSGWPGAIRCMVLAFLIILLVSQMEKVRLRLKI